MTKLKNDGPKTLFKDVYPDESKRLSPQAFMALGMFGMVVAFALAGLVLAYAELWVL